LIFRGRVSVDKGEITLDALLDKGRSVVYILSLPKSDTHHNLATRNLHDSLDLHLLSLC
jgi:hypothetical protein